TTEQQRTQEQQRAREQGQTGPTQRGELRYAVTCLVDSNKLRVVLVNGRNGQVERMESARLMERRARWRPESMSELSGFEDEYEPGEFGEFDTWGARTRYGQGEPYQRREMYQRTPRYAPELYQRQRGTGHQPYEMRRSYPESGESEWYFDESDEFEDYGTQPYRTRPFEPRGRTQRPYWSEAQRYQQQRGFEQGRSPMEREEFGETETREEYPQERPSWQREREGRTFQAERPDMYETQGRQQHFHAYGPGHQRGLRVQTAGDLLGMDVRNRQSENLGEIEDLALDPARGQIAYAVLSFGGVAGLGEKYFAVPWQAVNITGRNRALLDVDQQQLANAPGFDRNNWPNMANRQWAQGVQDFYRQAGAIEDELRPARTIAKASELIGKQARTGSGQDVGEIEELVFDTNRGRVLFAIVAQGGFLGIGDRLSAVPWPLIETQDDRVVIRASTGALRQHQFSRGGWPTMDGRWVARVFRAYGLRPYWQTGESLQPRFGERSVRRPFETDEGYGTTGGMSPEYDGSAPYGPYGEEFERE
ncbi:MAG: PRC-barrel domain-containing protein, partial [Planctomycetota bacterium]